MAKYRKEFFDRDYTKREAYSRVWKYARKYKVRLFIGIFCGMLTAGTLVPFFQIVQPALQHVEGYDQGIMDRGSPKTEMNSQKQVEESSNIKGQPRNDFEKQIRQKSSLPSWYPKVERLADRFGISLQDERGGMGGALLLIVCIIIPSAAFVRLILLYLNHYCLSWSGARAVADLRMELLAHVQKQSLQFFGRIDVGQVMSRINGDPNQIHLILTTILSELAMAPFEILVSVGFIVWFAISNDMMPTLALIFIGFPLFVLPVQMLGKRIKKWAHRAMERGSLITAKIHEIITCIKIVKSYNAEDYENRQYADTNEYMLKSAMRGLRVGLLVGPAVETVGLLMICGFLVWCFSMDIKISDVVPMLAPLLIIYKPVKKLSQLQVQIETSMAALSRIYSLQDLDMQIPEKTDAISKTLFKEKMAFNNVSFKYDTADSDAVHNVSFEIPRGKMVAVVGGTGSGKSTTAGLLTRFYDPQSGSVTMDGIDLRDMKISDIRHLVGTVTQESLLFNDTIEENIRYGTPDATHEQVVAAAKMANAHDFIMSQPEGYSRNVGEKGFALSGGERQRIAIARAILRNPPILILDEATSALDTVTERLVQDALANLMKNRTVFAIAHRLSTIRNADMILVMNGGEIVERGSHDELYAKGGVYRKLCDMQQR